MLEEITFTDLQFFIIMFVEGIGFSFLANYSTISIAGSFLSIFNLISAKLLMLPYLD